MTTIPFKTLRDQWMADAEFREAYDRISSEMEIAFAIAEARHRAKLSQQELADKLGTSQAAIARLERGSGNPTVKTLKRIGDATGTRFHIQLLPA